jgi:hypothetical protein
VSAIHPIDPGGPRVARPVPPTLVPQKLNSTPAAAVTHLVLRETRGEERRCGVVHEAVTLMLLPLLGRLRQLLQRGLAAGAGGAGDGPRLDEGSEDLLCMCVGFVRECVCTAQRTTKRRAAPRVFLRTHVHEAVADVAHARAPGVALHHVPVRMQSCSAA